MAWRRHAGAPRGSNCRNSNGKLQEQDRKRRWRDGPLEDQIEGKPKENYRKNIREGDGVTETRGSP